ncbi:unnamed protein product [Alopecurus aequalis]
MKSLLGKLATLMGEEFAKLKNLQKEFKLIKDELTSMKDPQTKKWRDIVREMSYDMEDIVDEIAGQIKEINALVLDASAGHHRYKLDIPPSRSEAIDPQVTTLYENAANLVGVEALTNELVNFLADNDKRLKMVSIVGFGGVGKTTLANVVYGRLKGNFNLSASVSVSQKSDIPKLLHSLLSQLGSTSHHDCELNDLLDQLREHLKSNRLLQHLETLDVPTCDNIPSDIFHLPCLMHLNVESRLLDGIGSMKFLQHLSAFDIRLNTLENIKGLGELTNLKYLIVERSRPSDHLEMIYINCLYSECGLFPEEDRDRRMDALITSLRNLYNLEDLHINMWGFIDGLILLSPAPTPYRLERLIVSPKCWFSRVPSWIGDLRNLGELQCQVAELQNYSVGILAVLPALVVLDIQVREPTDGMIVIYGRGAFPALKYFKLLLCSTSYLSFKAGAMPKLQKLKLKFKSSRLQKNGFAPADIEHLLALEDLSARFGCSGAEESDKTSIESAFRSSIRMQSNFTFIDNKYLLPLSN